MDVMGNHNQLSLFGFDQMRHMIQSKLDNDWFLLVNLHTQLSEKCLLNRTLLFRIKKRIQLFGNLFFIENSKRAGIMVVIMNCYGKSDLRSQLRHSPPCPWIFLQLRFGVFVVSLSLFLVGISLTI